MNLESASGDQIPFSDPEAMFAGFTKEDMIQIAYISGDFMLAIDDLGIVRDIVQAILGESNIVCNNYQRDHVFRFDRNRNKQEHQRCIREQVPKCGKQAINSSGSAYYAGGINLKQFHIRYRHVLRH